ncbi:alpha/beta fold hydrolase [uncultured Desulfosarcina sp.]|uniref:alpha/beta hydrolase n=1 Tax=uncultured Desulfosarcina sp. TaxID=218289 RepID=UPI0029C6389F|nr:alpha/beta fold hydrolase [uncultured Desulfosarcina sp.]
MPVIPDRLDHLDNYLLAAESQVAGIRKDCEKKIVWHGSRRRQRDLAIVYVHGFSASRMETWPLCDRLAEVLKANLFYTRLTGHGRDGAAMAAATVLDWQADAMEALAVGRLLGRKIILVGTSTGGTLATWLAAQPSAARLIDSLILISPNFMPKNPLAAAFLWPPALRLLERFFGGWRSFSVYNPDQARFWTVRYPIRAIGTMMQLVHRSWKLDLKSVPVPVLMLVNPWDRVINVSLALLRYRAFGSPHKKLVLFRGNRDPGRHVLAGKILSPETTDKALTVIESFLIDRES